MNRSVLPMALSALLIATHAQGQAPTPVFTAPMVHPITSELEPAQGTTSKRVTGNQLALRSVPPRKQAQTVSDTFQQACLKAHGQPEAVADWALSQGFVTAPALSRELASKLAPPGEAAQASEGTNVFARAADDDSLLLISSGQPIKCAVLTRLSVDGPQLRARMEALVAEGTGQKAAPSPVLTLDMGARNTPQAARMVGYKFVADDVTQSWVVLSPVTVGKGIAFLALSLDTVASPAAPVPTEAAEPVASTPTQ